MLLVSQFCKFAAPGFYLQQERENPLKNASVNKYNYIKERHRPKSQANEIDLMYIAVEQTNANQK